MLNKKSRSLPVVGDKREKLTADKLFRAQFLPLYPPGSDLELVRRTDANPAGNPEILKAAEQTGELFARLAPQALQAPDLDLDFSDDSIHRLGALLTEEARDRLFAQRATAGEPSLLVHFVLHGTLYICLTLARTRGAGWLMRNPLWETRMRLVSAAGEAELSPFSWFLRCLSDDEIGQVSLGDKYRAYVEEPTKDVSEWAVIASPDRRLPRLSRPRYDLLVPYLKAHLPELGDVGEHFPSPVRFSELGFRFLDALLVGGGKMLLLWGPTETGIHFFFLNRAGFSKAVFMEADPVPEARVTRSRSTDGIETIVVEASRGGAPQSQEMLWWGP